MPERPVGTMASAQVLLKKGARFIDGHTSQHLLCREAGESISQTGNNQFRLLGASRGHHHVRLNTQFRANICGPLERGVNISHHIRCEPVYIGRLRRLVVRFKQVPDGVPPSPTSPGAGVQHFLLGALCRSSGCHGLGQTLEGPPRVLDL